MIEKLHHVAYRCRDSEETREFYEDFLGLTLIKAFEIKETKTGRKTSVLHTFYQMDDKSCIAFFEAPNQSFNFIKQHDFDLHIALEVSYEILLKMYDSADILNDLDYFDGSDVPAETINFEASSNDISK